MPLKDVPVELTHTTTSAVVTVKSNETGAYSYASLPAGTYDLWIPVQGFFFRHFEQRGITLANGQALRLNIVMEEHLNSTTPGENPIELIEGFKSRMTPQPGAAPRMPDGTPDLSGVWLQGDGPMPPEPEMLPWAADLLKQRLRSNSVDSPNTRCLPGSLPLTFLMRFVQARDMLVILVEDVVGYRQIYLDGRPHPANWNPTWFGHSVGHWEGDTLVVETVGITDRSWLSFAGHPHTDQLRIIERFHRSEKGRMELETTFFDPGAFTRPWVMPMVWDLAPAEDVMEYICENDRDAAHYRN